MNDNALLVKITEAAKILGLSTATVQKLVADKKLTGVGFGNGGRKNFVTRASINALVNEN